MHNKHRVSVLLMSGLILFVAALSAVMTAGAQAPAAATLAAPAAAKLKNPVATSAASVTAGAAAYKKYCSFCHGATAKGNGPLAPKDSMPPDLTDAKWEHGSTDGEIFTLISNGGGATSKMIAFKTKMPEQDIWHIVNFLRSLGPKAAVR